MDSGRELTSSSKLAEEIHESQKVLHKILYLSLMGNKYNSFVFQSLKDAFVEDMGTNTGINSTEWIIKQVDVSVNKQKATLYKNMQGAVKDINHFHIFLYNYGTQFSLPLSSILSLKCSKISNLFLPSTAFLP
jgi:hypothetical protein